MKSRNELEQAYTAMRQEKGKVCISIVVPTHRLSPERRVDQLEVQKAIDKVRDYMEGKYPDEVMEPLLARLDELYGTIDFNHQPEGLGLYVSENIKLAVPFPYHVEEKVLVSNKFDARDILYKLNYGNTYFVLVLSEKKASLFEGNWGQLDEVKDYNFPIYYREAYAYERPVRSSTLAGSAHVKSFEKDKSFMEEIRITGFFRSVDQALNEYLLGIAPLIVMAPKKELSWFEEVSAHRKLIIDKIPGNYEYRTVHEIAELAWPAMWKYLTNERMHMKEIFSGEIGNHRGVNGIQEVWKAASEGRGFKLLVEKDFKKPGFVESGKPHLFLRQPVAPHAVLPDVVNDVIEMVLDKNGQIFFTDNGTLKEYNHIALITRY
jgi:Bacterial archaeo-eukaryotic release factor family 3